MKSLIRIIIIVVVVGGLGFVGYKYFLAPKTAAPTGGLQTTAGVGTGQSATPQIATDTAGASASASDASADFLSTLLSVESISLDQSIFTSKSFTVLQDFNRPIPPDDNPGRDNPFAPIGADGPTSAIEVSTSNPSSVSTTGSTLNGTLVASDSGATRWFEYGLTSAFGMMTTPKVQATPGTFTETVDKLIPNTVYYVRADASINGVTTLGNTLTWRTAEASRQ